MASAKNRTDSMTVFVTVGTTKFEKLVSAVTTYSVCKTLKSLGYEKLKIQTGDSGVAVPGSVGGLVVEHYDYKPSLEEDVAQASLVISHAGAGSCMESLGAGKPLLVVINEDLMNNHQLELAQQLYKDGHIYFCNCSDIEETLTTMEISSLKPYSPGQPELFSDYLDQKMNIAR